MVCYIFVTVNHGGYQLFFFPPLRGIFQLKYSDGFVSKMFAKKILILAVNDTRFRLEKKTLVRGVERVEQFY